MKKQVQRLSPSEKWEILRLYCKGKNPFEIADRVGYKKEKIKKFIDAFDRSFYKQRSIQLLTAGAKTGSLMYMPKEKIQPNYISKEFLDLLSDELADLSEAEYVFCRVIVEALDPIAALQVSNLDKGLPPNARNRELLLRLRAKHLVEKTNVASLLGALRKEKYKKVTEMVSPARLQSEMLELFESSKTAGDRKSCISLLKQLGDSVGLYSTNINVNTLDPATVIDCLLDELPGDRIND